MRRQKRSVDRLVKVSAVVVLCSRQCCLSRRALGVCRPIVGLSAHSLTPPRNLVEGIMETYFALGVQQLHSSASRGLRDSVVIAFLIVAHSIEAIGWGYWSPRT